MNQMYISGCEAVSLGAKLAQVEVVAAYPITPQTSIVEHLASYIEKSDLAAEMVHVEGEHSAMSVCVGAASVGARPFTATAGQGLAYMQEPVFWAAGLRLPIVMAVTNRSLLAPNTIFCDHQDSLSHRDSGWAQIYVQNCQEALDFILIAYKLAEDQSVLLPVMVCLDGFFVSHLYEPVEIPDQAQVSQFLPKRDVNYPTLDPSDPKMLNVLVPPEYYTEFEYDKHRSLLRAATRLEDIFTEFQKCFGRRYANIEAYALEGAERILIGMGSMVGTVKAVVDDLRARGEPVGGLGVRTFRPFPRQELVDMLKGVHSIGVLDRSISFGSSGPLYQEVVESLYRGKHRPNVVDFIVGLGGRDISVHTVNKAFHDLKEIEKAGKDREQPIWLDINQSLIDTWKLGGQDEPQY